MRLTSTITLALVLAAAAVVAAVPMAAAEPLGGELQDVRAATARFHSIHQAEAAGYVQRSACVSSPLGGMGVHYENAALMADDAIDPLAPEILVYAPNEQGKLKLVAVEYWKRDADGSLATAADRPTLFGQPFNGPMPGHGPFMPTHYDLHVWLWEPNPNGMFAPFNPAIVCP